MLEYLVTSRVRRRLLMLLWGERANGSAGELADRAGVSLASTHDELHAMKQVLLVESRREGHREVFSANWNHPDAEPIRALASVEPSRTLRSTSFDETLKRRLKALGAPLRGLEPLDVAPADQVETLLSGVELARRDAVVARALPICFWRLRDALGAKALGNLAARAEEKHALGFFLELTSELGGDRRLLGLADALRDRRMKSVREFFQPTPASAKRERRGSFALAEKWGFRMDMDLESFRSLFKKFVPQ